MFARLINRAIVLPTAGFTLGVATFIRAWPDEAGSMTMQDMPTTYFRSTRQLQRTDVLNSITESRLYRDLMQDPQMYHTVQSEKIPAGHRAYHVGQGELFGPNKLEIDPLIFHNEQEGVLVVIYHLGKGLGNEKGLVHKGVLSLLLDEALCYCGFPQLPHKRGVTAKLHLDFIKDIPVDSTVVLRAKVSEHKGRKCIIDGTIESMRPGAGSWLWSLSQIFLLSPSSSLKDQTITQGTLYAKANCILVEPKWMKYLSWVQMF